MRRLARNLTAELVRICCDTVRTHSNATLEFVSDEYNLLDISIQPLLLYISPLLLLRICTALVEEHPSYTDHQKNIYPTDSECEFYWFLFLILFCHFLYA